MTTINYPFESVQRAKCVDIIFHIEMANVEEDEATESDDGKENEAEDCDYAKLNEGHTMLLPPNQDCKVTKTGITDEERDLILSLHNELRAKVSTNDTHTGIQTDAYSYDNTQID